MLQSSSNGSASDPIDRWACYSKDGRDLIGVWREDKKSRKVPFEIVQNNEELSQVDHERTEFLLGIFSNGHIPMDWKRDKSPKGQPSLEEMTTAAIKNLQKSDKGFLLMVSSIYYFNVDRIPAVHAR